ncbi:hypothetical protein AMTR_s00024p00036760 [Amborella trichopoda]|uniref:Uncharacterized protein n=1 Tax=Amborella trichopoda TaxID=13333 RepID=W1PLV6_AMBTC|nr:hypothetical protein AMTR_s00024p00036760 [Amborella trichopoda]
MSEDLVRTRGRGHPAMTGIGAKQKESKITTSGGPGHLSTNLYEEGTQARNTLGLILVLNPFHHVRAQSISNSKETSSVNLCLPSIRSEASLAIVLERNLEVAIAALTEMFTGNIHTLMALHNSPSVLKPTRVRVPKPKPFGGPKNAMELENSFELWSTTSSCSCPRRGSSEPNHHVPHRRYHALVEDKGHRQLETSPWKALRKFKHTIVLECVKQFSSLMLDINNMPKEDKHFNFMTEL